jgi:hypothetical protein
VDLLDFHGASGSRVLAWEIGNKFYDLAALIQIKRPRTRFGSCSS